VSGPARHTETDPLEDAMQKPLITPEQAATVQGRAAASFAPLLDYLRTADPPAMAAAATAGRSIREGFRRPA
jgi:hypothetical protein